MKNLFYLVVGIAFIAGSFYLFLQKPAPDQYQRVEIPRKIATATSTALKIGEEVIPVEMADTPEKRTLGLSGRESLEEGTGLLFLFDISGQHGFWMKDMRFSIDIIWISENWVVVDIDKDVKPETFPKIFSPSTPAKYVLEVPAGTAERKHIDMGQEVYLIGQN